MKKLSFLMVLVLAMTAFMAGCGGSGDAESSESGNPVVKIGVFEPASGDNGAGGKQETLGIQYANSVCPTVEIGGTTYDVKLEIVDNESSTDKGPTAAQSLVSAGVSVVLGSYGSGVSIAASDIFGSAGIPAIGVTCTNPQVTEGNDHYFRICFLDPFQGTVLANFANDVFQAKTAYCIAKLGDDYSVGLCNYFQKAFEGLGGKVVYETFPEGNSDFASYVANAIKANADVFFAPVSIEAAALIIDQAAAQGMTMPILASDTWDSNVITGAAAGKDIDIYVTTFYQEGGDPEFDAGIKAWIESDSVNLANNNGNTDLAAVTAMGYDAYFTALEAMKAAGSIDPADIMAALPGVTYEGVSGAISFNEIGDANRDVAYVKYFNSESGAWELKGAQGI